MTDEQFIKQTFKLAKKGISKTSPNPMVGAVLVKNGQVIATGYHKEFGSAHAEIEVLKKVKDRALGSTLYLNLEPCCHFGKTPPCASAIIKAGIKKVVCSTLDPNPKVSGKGIEQLKKAGIRVLTGILENNARKLNETFFTFQTKMRPFIALKFASSLDGKIATKTSDSKWITNGETRKYSRKLRLNYQAILVGINTVIKDNPHLGVRIKGKKDPVRIILDSRLRIPFNSMVLRDNNVLIITTVLANDEKKKLLNNRGIPVLTLPDKKISIKKLTELLFELNILSVLVEGGSKVLGSFIDEKLVDKMYVFQSPIIIGGDKAVTAVGGEGADKISRAIYLENILYKKIGDNQLISGYPKFKDLYSNAVI